MNSSRDTETLSKIAIFFIAVIDKHAYYDQIKFSIASGSILKKKFHNSLLHFLSTWSESTFNIFPLCKNEKMGIEMKGL